MKSFCRYFVFFTFVVFCVSSIFPSASQAARVRRQCVDAACLASLQTIVLPVSPTNIVAQPGQSFAITYNWQAAPTANNYGAFVHFYDANGVLRLQDDHAPPVPTSQWHGSLSYSRTVKVPADLQTGQYRIVMGLFYYSGGYINLPLSAGTGVIPLYNRYQVGLLTLSAPAAASVEGRCGASIGNCDAGAVANLIRAKTQLDT